MKLKFDFSKIEFDRVNDYVEVSCHVIDEEECDPSVDKSLFCEIKVTMPYVVNARLSFNSIKQQTKEILKTHLIEVIDQL